ncbi:MAG: type II toxin-antitoxin system RelE/ParE family toxin [Armatimonadetes bacterium]|nr:type II toxin-antitoxin system RelE/ParE family toxin [Armatimonadota bacterium]
MYRVELTRAAQQDLAGLERPLQARVLARLEELAAEPRPSAAAKLTGSLSVLYRIRVGDYRVIYAIEDDERLVVCAAIARRDHAYRDLSRYLERVIAYLAGR